MITEAKHMTLTEGISTPFLGAHPFHFHLAVNCMINYSSNYVKLCVGLKAMYFIAHDFVVIKSPSLVQ